ncbi:MAG: DNA polymerase III subunit delta' [Bdellovibrionales bacterium]|nr:DNA polymerase III subunit delta' [Bdellovibrionales bacterium]
MARLIDEILGHASAWEQLERQRRDGHLPHALAFTGPSGIGKRRMAWALAQALLCEGENKPCGQCGSCRRVEQQQSESVLLIEPQGPQIKLEAAHQVLEFLSLRRLGAARVIIVNEAQLMNAQAANSLLKVVEEPPPNSYFIFIVPEITQLLPTLRSRSQVLRFYPLSSAELAQGEKVEAWMLKSARGSFERLAAFQDEETGELRQLAFDFLTSALSGERRGLERILGETKDREAALQSARFLQQILRDWTLLGTGEEIHSDFKSAMAGFPERLPRHKVELWRRAQQMESDLIGNVDRVLLFENFFYRSHSDLR